MGTPITHTDAARPAEDHPGRRDAIAAHARQRPEHLDRALAQPEATPAVVRRIAAAAGLITEVRREG